MSAVIIDIKPARVIKESVFEEVENIAKKDAPDGTSYEQVTAVEEDSHLLTQYWRDSLQQLAIFLADYYVSIGEAKDEDVLDVPGVTVPLVLDLPNNWNSGMLMNLENAVNGYIASYIKSRWFRNVKKDDESVYLKDCDRFVSEARNICCARVRPKKVTRECMCNENNDMP